MTMTAIDMQVGSGSIVQLGRCVVRIRHRRYFLARWTHKQPDVGQRVHLVGDMATVVVVFIQLIGLETVNRAGARRVTQ